MELNEWLQDELAQSIWTKKYCNNGESLEQWFDRVSMGNMELRELLVDKKFLFGGRILANRGIQNERKLTYSNCYVLQPPADSIEGIYSTAGKLARTFSYGGGVGIDISKLRPKGSPVNNAAKTTSGAVSFMETFSQVSKVIGQNGRRGALMISMDCDHPDIEDFINAKKDTESLNECNISVKVNDVFMKKVMSPNEQEGIKEKRLFAQLAANNWNYAEPGILYWDSINHNNLLSKYIEEGTFKYAGVNPCAEEPLPAGGSCLLGALNLSEFVDNAFGEKPAFNVPEFKKAVKIAVKALNEVLDEGLELHPLEEQRNSVGDWRQIGLGIMGFGDMLIKMRIPYGSERCLALVDSIGSNLVKAGLTESCRLAKEKGKFSKCNNDLILTSNFIQSHKLDNTLLTDIAIHGLRNSQIFTIAPTGSTSTMLGVSGGVEPIFDYMYTRTTKSLHGEDVTYQVITPIIQQALEYEGIDLNNKETQSIPAYICRAKTINPLQRLHTQSAWQQHIDASISSTLNLPNSASVQDVELLYQEAWLTGCKGLTIYREGCAREGILNSQVNTQEKESNVAETRSEVDTDISNCIATGTKIGTGCGSLWITAYFHKDTHKLCHIFLNKGSSGGCNSYMVGLSRMISLAGKSGATLDEIIDQLDSVIACPSYVKKDNTSKGTSCPMSIGNALKELYKQFTQTEIHEEQRTGGPKCPECGASVDFTGGCNICNNCGWSKCN